MSVQSVDYWPRDFETNWQVWSSQNTLDSLHRWVIVNSKHHTAVPLIYASFLNKAFDLFSCFKCGSQVFLSREEVGYSDYLSSPVGKLQGKEILLNFFSPSALLYSVLHSINLFLLCCACTVFILWHPSSSHLALALKACSIDSSGLHPQPCHQQNLSASLSLKNKRNDV